MGRLRERVPDGRCGHPRPIRADHHARWRRRRLREFPHHDHRAVGVRSDVKRCGSEKGTDKGAAAACADHDAGSLR